MQIEKTTIVRLVLILITIINFVLEKFGVDVIPTNESWILMVVETAMEVASIGAAFWYNNSFSPKALKAQEYLRRLRESE